MYILFLKEVWEVEINRALSKQYLSAESVRKIDDYHTMVYQKISPYLTEAEAEWLKAETAPL